MTEKWLNKKISETVETNLNRYSGYTNLRLGSFLAWAASGVILAWDAWLH